MRRRGRGEMPWVVKMWVSEDVGNDERMGSGAG